MKKRQDTPKNTLQSQNKTPDCYVINPKQQSGYGRLRLQQDCNGGHREGYEGVCSERNVHYQVYGSASTIHIQSP